ncbi:MAG: hypothetical protein M5U34_31720 [Chloroflexi bacterium]|nr:hypothetical protein [Chloroflexota bacterium]
MRTANEHGALWLTETWEGVTLEVGVTAVTPGTIQLYANGALAASWPVQLSPGAAWHTRWSPTPGSSAPWEIRLLDNQANVLLTTTWPFVIGRAGSLLALRHLPDDVPFSFNVGCPFARGRANSAYQQNLRLPPNTPLKLWIWGIMLIFSHLCEAK